MSDEAVEAAELVAGGGETAAPVPAEGGAPDPLFDNIAETLGVMTEQAEEPKPEEAKAKDEKKEDDDEEDAEPEFDDLSDDRPWTPERHKKVKAQHMADRRKVGAMISQLSAREKKFKGKLEQFRTQKQQVDLIERRVMNDLNEMRTGTPDQAMAALARLSQRDPHSVYESISLAMLGKGPQSKADPKVAELEAKIARLERAAETREQSQTEEQRVVSEQRQVIAVLRAADEWPLLAGKAAENPQQIAEEFWQLYQDHRSRGGKLDVESFAYRIESTLRRKSMPLSRAKQNGTTASGADRDQETRASANPETAQSPPRSLSPSQSATSGAARRVVTEQELKDELVRSGPDDPFFKQFGIHMTGF